MIIFTVVNRNNNNNSLMYKKFIDLINKHKNFILDDYYYYEYKNYKNNYIRYHYGYNKLLSIEYLNYSGQYHREDGPAHIEYYNIDRIYKKQYSLNNKEYSYETYILEIKKLV